ncbi:MAG: prolyl oligopeptidase family serine peptidase, partial [Fulvivirga sp.]|nr:prolyl oligopeptidase family serine peptidase [Fulvivirga sp.]
MMRNSMLFTSIFLLLLACQDVEDSKETTITYPETAKVDSVDTYFGVEVPDPYRWLEDDRSEATASWVKAQNEVTHAYLNNIPFRNEIKQRLEELYNYERIYAPFQRGDYYYFYKNDGLQNQNVLYRKDSLNGEAEIFLDPNQFKEDGTISLGGTSFSDDGSLFTYMISVGGSDWRKAITIDVETKEQVDDTLRNIKFSGISWKGNEGFYYTRYQEPKAGEELSGITKNGKLYFHEVGTSQSEDELIYAPEREKARAGGSLTENNRFLVISVSEGTSGNKLFAQDLESDQGLVKIIDHLENNHYVVDSKGDNLLVYTNLDAPNYRLVEVDLNNPSHTNWVDVIPENDNVLSVNAAGGYLFASYLQDAKTAIKQLDYNGELVRDVELPGIGTARGFGGQREDSILYYTFTSFTDPSTIYRYDIETGESTLYEKPNVKFDPEDYTTEQVFYESKDGTKVPMFITYKKGLEMNGKNPTYLYSYGGFNISLRPSFSTSRIVWLENGGIYAQPNIRGGGEYGETWHEAGTKMNKQNVFDDFIAAAEYLFKNNYTSSDYLAIAGGSNGGLLVGATMTQRPDLAEVAFPAVGVLDMLRYHKFTIGYAWASDYGTSEDSQEMFEYLYGYSPLHNLEEGVEYPATLVTTADHDDR